MLYVIPAAGAGAVTVIVPVAVLQVGCVSVRVGAAGADGAAFIMLTVTLDMQPPAFFTVTLYVPGATAENTPVVLVYVVPSML